MNTQPVRIVQGTTNSFAIELADADGNVYTLSNGEKLVMGVKYDLQSPDPLFTQEATRDENGAYVVTIAPDATANLTPGRYYYDVSLQSDDEFYNIIELSAFDIIPGVTKWRASE